MGNERIIRVPRLPDSLLLEILNDLGELFKPSNKSIILYRSGSISITNDQARELGLGPSTFTIEAAEYSANQNRISISFRRGTSSGNWEDRQPSTFNDEFRISAHNANGTATPQDLVSAISVIEKRSSFLAPEVARQQSPEVRDIIDAQFAQLTALVTKMASQFDDRQAQLDKRKSEIEEEHAKLLENIKQQRESNEEILNSERSSLEKLRQELNDRDHMHVRRELRAKITEQLRTRLKEPLVSRQTGKIRFLVVIVCLFASTVLFYFALDAQRQIAASTDMVSKWSFIAKVIFSGVGAVGFVGYAVAWLRRIYLDDVQLERSLERYALDLDRASWSIETLMEMSKTEGAEIPTAWVEGVCNDLFSSSRQHEDPTPLQALGAMMDVAAGAEIGSSGTKITLNRRGAKAIADSAK